MCGCGDACVSTSTPRSKFPSMRVYCSVHVVTADFSSSHCSTQRGLVQAGARLEGVIKAEIQARMESVRVLRSESAQQAAAMTAGFARADKKAAALLDTQRLLHSKHEALQVAHESAARESASRDSALGARLDREAESCRNRIEREVAAVQLEVADKCKAIETLCKVWAEGGAIWLMHPRHTPVALVQSCAVAAVVSHLNSTEDLGCPWLTYSADCRSHTHT